MFLYFYFYTLELHFFVLESGKWMAIQITYFVPL